MTQCPRPDCTGSIDEDGFCDTCGLEAPAGAPAAAAPDPEPVSTRTGSTRTGNTWRRHPNAESPGAGRVRPHNLTPMALNYTLQASDDDLDDDDVDEEDEEVEDDEGDDEEEETWQVRLT